MFAFHIARNLSLSILTWERCIGEKLIIGGHELLRRRQRCTDNLIRRPSIIHEADSHITTWPQVLHGCSVHTIWMDAKLISWIRRRHHPQQDNERNCSSKTYVQRRDMVVIEVTCGSKNNIDLLFECFPHTNVLRWICIGTSFVNSLSHWLLLWVEDPILQKFPRSQR